MSLLVAALFLSMILFTVDELYLFKYIYWIDTFIEIGRSMNMDFIIIRILTKKFTYEYLFRII